MKNNFDLLNDANGIADTETVSRYLFSSNVVKSKVQWRAFQPPPNSQEVSIMRINDLSEQESWALGEDYVAKPSNRILKGRIDFQVLHVIKANLSVHADSRPHPRHANILGFAIQDADQLAQAQEMARVLNEANISPTKAPVLPHDNIKA